MNKIFLLLTAICMPIAMNAYDQESTRKLQEKLRTYDYQNEVDASFLKDIDQLLKNGADPNATDSDNRTALLYAAKNGSPEMVKLLLDNKAILDVSWIDKLKDFIKERQKYLETLKKKDIPQTELCIKNLQDSLKILTTTTPGTKKINITEPYNHEATNKLRAKSEALQKSHGVIALSPLLKEIDSLIKEGADPTYVSYIIGHLMF